MTDFVSFIQKRQVAILLACALVSALVFIKRSAGIGGSELWFSNGDQDSTLLIDSLRLNSHHGVSFIEHPGLGVYVLYGSGLKLQRSMKLIAVSNIDQLFEHPDPILLLPALYKAMRHQSMVLVGFIALMAAISVHLLSNRFSASIFTFMAMISSAGLLFQSLLARTELTSIFFVVCSILSLSGWSRLRAANPFASLILFLAGFFLCMAMFSKMVVLPLLLPILVCVALGCWIKRDTLPIKDGAKRVITEAALSAALLIYLAYYFSIGLEKVAYENTKIPGFLLFAEVLWLLHLAPKLGFLRLISRSFLWFMCGLLLCIPVILKYCQVEHFDTSKLILKTVFSTDMAQNSTYASAFTANFSGYWLQILDYLSYSSLTTMLFPLFVFSLFFASARGAFLSVIFGLCGIGMSLVMAMRYFGLHYTIYPDVFFILAIATALSSMKSGTRRLKYIVKWPAFSWAVLAGLLIIFSLRQEAYIREKYPKYNLPLRNALGYVHSGCNAAQEFSDRMKARYPDFEKLRHRIVEDPRLNGSEDGIKIMEQANIALLVSEFKY